MKRLAFVTFMAMMMVSLNAHAKNLQVGTVELSGTTEFSYTDQELEDGTDIDIKTTELEVDALYYVLENLGLGLTVSYLEQEFENVDSSAFSVGPQVLYNFSVSENASLFLKGSVVYAEAEVDSIDADGWGWSVAGGAKYFINNHVSLNGSVGYASLSLEDDFNNDADIKGFNFGVGFSLYFP